ncbi:LETM1like protein [Acanthamoeba castellanii str. Neff]|uniref:Mitochondrial proton/calcium exchanger protein n=1 Tax=Acanthamoeba castellanii (strain ATCC 30010 / Neff) TaxID=1257118 RepID=L8GSH2_ACACF|nr:LETM1like protein [Acanthamoeba castellanii str. Neff]ELR16119.1 LETM1like protein [Acanthamoeba castellanii str. Neff]
MAARSRYLATTTYMATPSATIVGTPFVRMSQTSMLRLGATSRGISSSAVALALPRGTSGSCAFLLGPHAAASWRRSGRSSATVLQWPGAGSSAAAGRLRVSEAACARYYATGGSLPDSNQSPKAVSAEDKEAVPKKTLVGRAVHSTKKVVTFIKEGIHHYWLGSKLLALNVRTAFNIAVRLKNGHTLTRRERQHMIRTTADLFRLVPFAVFVIVPFMEFLLPIALKIFPNMLPSTFQDTMKKEEDMRKQLLLKLKMASFLQDTLQEMAETGETHKVDAALRETISTLPEDVVEEAELEMDLQKGTPSDRQLKLEVLRNTNEKLREELEEEAETFKEIEALESPGSVIPEEDAEHLRDVAEALSVLASPVSAERKALEQLEAREALLARAKTLKDQETATVVDAVVKAVKTRSDRSKERLGQQLEDLLDDLREELSETEQKLGDKMVLIDKDRDGVITTEEVALACSLLKDRPSDAEIRNVLRVLDADEDGVVALEDVQKIRQKLEELHLEEAPAEEKERK